MTTAKKTTARKANADEVKITLAHPITRDADKQYLGLDLGTDYGPGDEITVNRNAAGSLVSSGYAALDPEDHDAVVEVLGDEAADNVAATNA